jgi:hypothetical protein
VKKRFQSLPFKCNLQRYNADRLCAMGVAAQIPMPSFTTRRATHVAKVMRRLVGLSSEVGLCTLKQVDP